MSKTESASVTKLSYLNILYGYVSLFYYGMSDNIRGPLYPEVLKHFGISNSAGSAFFAVASLMMIVSSALIPIVISRWGYLRVFQFGLACLTGSQFIYALSPSFPVMLLGSFVIGISIGTLGVVQNLLVLVGSPAEKLTLYMNGLHANYGGASLIAPLLVALVSRLSPHFQSSFWVTGAIGVVLLLSTFKVPGFLESKNFSATKPASKRLSGAAVFYACVSSCYVLAEILISTRLAQFVGASRGATLEEASYWTTLFFVGLFISRLIFTFVSFRSAPKTQLSISLFLSAVFLALGLLISPWFIALGGLAMGPAFPLMISFLRVYFPHQLESATTACIVGNAVFIVVMHLIAGPLSDAYGVAAAMALAPVFCLLGFLGFIAFPFLFKEGKDA